jgi:hypothetical protein
MQMVNKSESGTAHAKIEGPMIADLVRDALGDELPSFEEFRKTRTAPIGIDCRIVVRLIRNDKKAVDLVLDSALQAYWRNSPSPVPSKSCRLNLLRLLPHDLYDYLMNPEEFLTAREKKAKMRELNQKKEAQK